MNNNNHLIKSIQKGVVFGIISIFFVLIGFHVIGATLISKIFGTSVARGRIPEVQFHLKYNREGCVTGLLKNTRLSLAVNTLR